MLIAKSDINYALNEMQTVFTFRCVPREPATFVQRLPNVFQTSMTFGTRWVVVVTCGTRWVEFVHTSIVHWALSVGFPPALMML